MLHHLDVNNIALFAATNRTEEGLCRFSKQDFELDETASSVQRKFHAVLVCAWMRRERSGKKKSASKAGHKAADIVTLMEVEEHEV